MPLSGESVKNIIKNIFKISIIALKRAIGLASSFYCLNTLIIPLNLYVFLKAIETPKIRCLKSHATYRGKGGKGDRGNLKDNS